MANPTGPVSRSDNAYTALVLANGKKRYVQTISATTAGGNTTLTTTTIDGQAIPKGALYVFQGDADFQIELNSASRSLTNTNSLWVQAGQQEYQFAERDDTLVNWKGRTQTANVQVFVVC